MEWRTLLDDAGRKKEKKKKKEKKWAPNKGCLLKKKKKKKKKGKGSPSSVTLRKRRGKKKKKKGEMIERLPIPKRDGQGKKGGKGGPSLFADYARQMKKRLGLSHKGDFDGSSPFPFTIFCSKAGGRRELALHIPRGKRGFLDDSRGGGGGGGGKGGGPRPIQRRSKKRKKGGDERSVWGVWGGKKKRSTGRKGKGEKKDVRFVSRSKKLFAVGAAMYIRPQGKKKKKKAAPTRSKHEKKGMGDLPL